MSSFDVISMPDPWEYPWYAAWDLAFQCVAIARVDPGFAKEQLLLLLKEWYMHPNGQLPGLRVGAGRREPTGARRGPRCGCSNWTVPATTSSWNGCCTSC